MTFQASMRAGFAKTLVKFLAVCFCKSLIVKILQVLNTLLVMFYWNRFQTRYEIQISHIKSV